MTADAILAAVRARGSDARDLRDATHEAAHALDARARRWDRESIHRALLRRYRRDPAGWMRSEVVVRAVEQIVCETCGVDPGPVELWAGTAILESIRNGLITLGYAEFAAAVVEELRKPATRLIAEQILALGEARR